MKHGTTQLDFARQQRDIAQRRVLKQEKVITALTLLAAAGWITVIFCVTGVI